MHQACNADADTHASIVLCANAHEHRTIFEKHPYHVRGSCAGCGFGS